MIRAVRAGVNPRCAAGRPVRDGRVTDVLKTALIRPSSVVTVAANYLLGVDPFMQIVAAGAIVVLTFALVGLATGLGARYPRFGADATQAAGSYGGVMFMILAVLLIIVTIALVGWPSSIYMMSQTGMYRFRLTAERQAMMALSLSAIAAICLTVWRVAMRSGVPSVLSAWLAQ
jgi:putative ABC exporter